MEHLKPKHREFVRHYLMCRNATEAYRLAGYKSKNPDVDGPKLLGNPRIQAAIQENEAKIQVKFEVTQEQIIRELARVGFGNLMDVVGPDGKIQDPSLAGFVSSMSHSESSGEEGNSSSYSYSTHNKVKALELLGKHVGMWKDGNAQQGSDPATQRDKLQRISAYLRKRAGIGSQGTDKA